MTQRTCLFRCWPDILTMVAVGVMTVSTGCVADAGDGGEEGEPDGGDAGAGNGDGHGHGHGHGRDCD